MFSKNNLIILFSGVILLSAAAYSINRPRNSTNVVLITFDALRPDHLGCYGYDKPTSPNIDKVASEGVVFLNAIAQSSHTAPCMSSILTSTYPLQHGVFNFGDSLSAGVTPLSKVLKNNGYATAFFTNHQGIFIRGFKKYFNNFYTPIILEGDLGGNNFVHAQEITPLAIKWIENNKNSKFFIWIHYLEPHFPMDSSDVYRKMFSNDNLPSNNVLITAYGLGGLPENLASLNNYIKDFNYYAGLYDASIKYGDDQLGQILDYLQKSGLKNKTAVIISADHGEGFGEHGLYFQHGFMLYDELVKIPLIIGLAGEKTRNKRIEEQAQQIDIGATVLGILGITKPKNMLGISLITLFKDQKKRSSRYVFSFLLNRIAVRTENLKLIYNLDQKDYEFYNLKQDPGEVNNLAGKEKPDFSQLKNKMSAFLHDYELIDRKKKVLLSDFEKKALYSLGYVQ